MIDPQKLINPTQGLIEDQRRNTKTEKQYHDNPGVGNSDLKLLESSTRLFMKKKLKGEQEENPYVDMNRHMKMGTMVEQKLLEPERFNENFIERNDMETPSSPNQKEFVQYILDNMEGDGSGAIMKEVIQDAQQEAYANPSPEKAANLYQKLGEYIAFQVESDGKGVFDQDEKETMLRVMQDIISHNKASRLLIETKSDEEAHSQLPMFGEIRDTLCKGLGDRIIISGDKAMLVDLKVTSKKLNYFGYWFLRRKYYRQFAHYSRLLVKKMNKEMGIEEPTVKPIVIVSRKEEPYGTIVRKVPVDLMHRGVKELNILLKRLNWHIRNNKWDRPQDYYTDHIPDLDFDSSNIPELRL